MELTTPEGDALGRALLEYAWQSGSAVVILFGLDGRIVDANASARRNLVCQPGGLAKDVFVCFQGDVDVAALARESAEPRVMSVNTKGDLPDSVFFSFRRIGEQVLAIGEMDYTEVERLRKNLFETNNDLSNMARDLQKTNSELSRLNNLKNEFLGVAAHDLRSPIGAIKTYTDLLLLGARPLLPDQHISFLQTIQSLSELMLKMLGELLDITAIESGKVLLHATSVDLCAVARESARINSILAERKNIKVDFQAPEEPIMACVDEFKVRQVLDNLIGNAIKFSPHGSKVHAALRPVGGKCHITVQDEGPGIPEEELERIFHPFAKSRAAPTDGEKSTGLGLAIVQKIVAAHHGAVRAENADGKGAVFLVTLPVESPEKREV